MFNIPRIIFEHNPREIGSAFHRAGAEIGPRLNIKYGFNWASKRPFMDRHELRRLEFKVYRFASQP